MVKRVRSPFGEFFMLENFPLVSRAMAEGRFSALGSPDEWELSERDAWQIRDYCVYVLDFYRDNGVASRDDIYFFQQTISKVDCMLRGGGYLWNRPTALEDDIAAGRQTTLYVE